MQFLIKKFANVSCTGFVVKVALKNSVETYTLSHYIIVTIIARISVSSKEKKKRRGGGVEWRKFTTVSGKVAKRDAERSFLESNCLPLNPASRLCSRVFVLTELIPSASRKEVADRGGPTPPSSLLRAITPRFNRDPRWSSRRQFITSRWATLRALPPSYSSSRTELRGSSSDPCLYSKRPLIAEFFFLTTLAGYTRRDEIGSNRSKTRNELIKFFEWSGWFFFPQDSEKFLSFFGTLERLVTGEIVD